MRSTLLLLALVAATPVLASEPGYWYFDVHEVGPTFTGHYKGTQNSQPVDFDLVGDLGLAKTTTKPGGSIEYQGPRFGLELSMDEQDYGGSNTINRNIVIGGQTYNAQALVTSSLKMTCYTGNWTIRVFKWPDFWIGLDLGAEVTAIDLNASGVNYLLGVPATAVFKSPLPMPQLGPSAGFKVFGDRLVARAHYHFLDYKGASYHHTGADVRFFPLKWLGVRAFVANESWKVPDNSVAKDLEIGLDRSGAGFGVVARF